MAVRLMKRTEAQMDKYLNDIHDLLDGDPEFQLVQLLTDPFRFSIYVVRPPREDARHRHNACPASQVYEPTYRGLARVPRAHGKGAFFHGSW